MILNGFHQIWNDIMMIDDDKGDCSTFWDVQIAPNLYIVHYSNSVKSWEKRHQEKIEKTNLNSLDNLFHTWYKKSQNYLDRYQKEEQKGKADDKAAAAAKSRQEQQQQQNAHYPAKVHRMVTRRFK
jgi:hypothetical protein